MSEETTKLIKELADKFGTTAEHLWEVLVKQAPITSAIHLTIFGVVLIAALISIPMAIYKTRKDDEISLWVLPAAVFTMSSIILSCELLPIALAGFFNPEFWALKQFIK